MLSRKIVFIDIETNSLNFRKGDIKLIAFFNGDGVVVTTTIIDKSLADMLKDRNIIKVFHNAKFDVGFFKNKGYEVNNYHCTFVMAQVLNEDKLSLKDLSKKYLGVEVEKSMQHSDNWQDGIITQVHRDYVAKDVECTRDLYDKLHEELVKRNLLEVYERE